MSSLLHCSLCSLASKHNSEDVQHKQTHARTPPPPPLQHTHTHTRTGGNGGWRGIISTKINNCNNKKKAPSPSPSKKKRTMTKGLTRRSKDVTLKTKTPIAYSSTLHPRYILRTQMSHKMCVWWSLAFSRLPAKTYRRRFRSWLSFM